MTEAVIISVTLVNVYETSVQLLKGLSTSFLPKNSLHEHLHPYFNRYHKQINELLTTLKNVLLVYNLSVEPARHSHKFYF
jgi:hypothetical protein